MLQPAQHPGADYRRAAALILHRLHNDVAAGKVILREAVDLGRPAAATLHPRIGRTATGAKTPPVAGPTFAILMKPTRRR